MKQSGQKSHGKKPGSNPNKAGAGAAKADVGSIFAQLKKDSADTAAAPGRVRRDTAVAATAAAGKARKTAGAPAPPSATATAKEEGRYVAPDPIKTAMAMDDDAFFRGSGGGSGSGGAKSGKKHHIGAEEVDRVVTEDELQRMLHGDAGKKKGSAQQRPGYSELCPFDCDCCF